jgi:hypothetical protein
VDETAPDKVTITTFWELLEALAETWELYGEKVATERSYSSSIVVQLWRNYRLTDQLLRELSVRHLRRLARDMRPDDVSDPEDE